MTIYLVIMDNGEYQRIYGAFLDIDNAEVFAAQMEDDWTDADGHHSYERIEVIEMELEDVEEGSEIEILSVPSLV